MGRRHVKEFRPDEALSLISADRNGEVLQCPCCGGVAVSRNPTRPEEGQQVSGRVTLTCNACGRIVSYIDRGVTISRES